MFSTIFMLIFVGIIFFISNFFIKDHWKYYIPVTMVLLSIWLKILEQDWDSDRYLMKVAKTEPGAAAGWISIISVTYGIACVFFGFWIPLVICIFVFIVSASMKFSHPY